MNRYKVNFSKMSQH